MFGLIKKKIIINKLNEIKKENRKESLYANYKTPMSKEQEIKNAYSQGYEDGTDNVYNALIREIK